MAKKNVYTKKLIDAILRKRIRNITGCKLQGYREAAKECGISPATMLRVAAGRRPDLDTFLKLCVWLGKSPNEILGWPKRRYVKARRMKK